MNLQSLRRAIPALAVLVIVLVLFAIPRLGPFFASAHYEQCSHLATADPMKGLAYARSWLTNHPGSPMARHCEAVALFAVKDYGQAAEVFDALAKEVGSANPALSAQLSRQATKAHEAAGQSDKTLSIDINK